MKLSGLFVYSWVASVVILLVVTVVFTHNPKLTSDHVFFCMLLGVAPAALLTFLVLLVESVLVAAVRALNGIWPG